MKMAKKFLAVALAGVLALSVLTGCGKSVKSKDIADALNKMGMNVEQSKDMDKTAESTLTAIEAIINSETNTAADEDDKITLENAVDGHYGKVIKDDTITDSTDAVKKALGMMATGTAAETANKDKKVRVALVNIENAKKDASLQAHFVKEYLVRPRLVNTINKIVVEPGKLGTAKTKDGKYMLVVIVNDVVAKSGT